MLSSTGQKIPPLWPFGDFYGRTLAANFLRALQNSEWKWTRWRKITSTWQRTSSYWRKRTKLSRNNSLKWQKKLTKWRPECWRSAVSGEFDIEKTVRDYATAWTPLSRKKACINTDWVFLKQQAAGHRIRAEQKKLDILRLGRTANLRTLSKVYSQPSYVRQ